MASNVLYVANFPDDYTEENLRELFSPYGEITTIEVGKNPKFDINVALVEMRVEKHATQAMHKLNGTTINGQYLYISYPAPDPKLYTQGLSSKARKTAESIVKALGEEYRKPVRRIHVMVLLCGFSFVQAVLKEAQEIYAGEGMKTFDGSRKRSLGGVFFTLANRYYSPTMMQLIHWGDAKLPGYQKSDDRIFYHLIVNPHKDDV